MKISVSQSKMSLKIKDNNNNGSNTFKNIFNYENWDISNFVVDIANVLNGKSAHNFDI